MYSISVSNGILKDKHSERMGNAIWLFLWFLDKVTKVDREGLGWVLGGKPIKLAEIPHLERRTTQRYLAILKKEGYIEVTRTMYGVIIKVKKAKKIFNKDVTKVAHQDRTNTAHPHTKSGASQVKSGASNKIIQVDSTVDNTIGAEFVSDPSDFEEAEVIIHGEPEIHESPPVSLDLSLLAETFQPVNRRWRKMLDDHEQVAAGNDCLKSHGLTHLLGVAKALEKTNEIRYMPVITNLIELRDKLTKWELQLKKLAKESEKNQILI